MNNRKDRRKALEEELKRIKHELNETYRGVTELTNELVTRTQDKKTSELTKEVRYLSQELEETYHSVTELANELYDTNNALHESEARLGLALDGANLGIWEWDLESGELTLSPQWYNILAYSHDDIESHITAWEQRIHPDDLSVWHGALTAYKKGQQPSFRTEHRFLSKTGQWLWVMISGRGKKKGTDGKLLRLTGIMMNIDDRKRAEKEVRQFNEELELRVAQRTAELEQINQKLKTEITNHKQTEIELRAAQAAAETANRVKTLFFANMSHELRTPLNSILGFTQLLQRSSNLSKEENENLTTINRSGEHLLGLINNVLEVAKIEAGKITPNPSSFDLYKLIEDIERMFRIRTDAKNLSLEVEINEDVPRYVVSDESKLRQILINLLGNAVKFTEKGKIGLHVKAGTIGAGKEASNANEIPINIEVKDTGIGIAENEIDRVFEDFEQTQSGRRVGGGTGLGMPITQAYVQCLGGDINVHSQVGKGTLFRLTIRVKEGLTIGCKKAEPAVQVLRLQSDEEGKYKILIVDDVKENRRLLTQLLRSAGFLSKSIGNAREAIDVFHQWQAHLILMDCKMPEMDGLEAIRRIRTTPLGKKVPIISVSASAFEEDRHRAFKAGANDFVSKPFKVSVLFESIRNQLGVHYVYQQDESAKDKAQAAVILRNVLQEFPSQKLEKLREAIETGNMCAFNEILDRLDDQDSPLVDHLRSLAEHYHYEAILDLLTSEM